MALAECQHHSAHRQETPWPGRRDRAELHGDDPGDPPPPTPLPQPELFDLSFDEEPSGSRPDRLVGLRPQDRVQRHTVEQLADVAPKLQLLDDLVSQMVNQLVEVFRLPDTALPEQVTDVPMISPDSIPQRFVCRGTERVEPSCCSSPSRTLTFQFVGMGFWL